MLNIILMQLNYMSICSQIRLKLQSAVIKTVTKTAHEPIDPSGFTVEHM